MKMEKEITLLTGTICVTSEARQVDQGLSFHKGDVLTVISHNKEDQLCIVSGVDGSIGEVPISYLLHRPSILLQPMNYYHENVTREEAESLLTEDGQFLVRPSCNNNSLYSIAVNSDGVVKHYLVAMCDRKLTIDGKKYFQSLPYLIEFYQSAIDTPNELVPQLYHPLNPKGSLKHHVDTISMEQCWGLSDDDIEIVELIGRGEFGDVHAGVYRGLQIAVKTLSHEEDQTTDKYGFLQEAAVMTHLRHKNLVQLVGVVFKSSSLQMIVLELMSRGSLKKYLSSRGRSVISQLELLHYARNICEGMLYLCKRGFVHRDLALRNVLVNGNGEAKISDFGMSRKADIHIPHEGGKFPVKWTAPEALKESLFSEKSDVWSFGVCLWEVYSFGRVPYPSILSDNVLEQLEDGYMMDPPEGCPDGIYDIMTECWALDPQLRPNFYILNKLLAKSFGESRTPYSSPIPARRALANIKEVEKLINSSIASEVYHDAPITHIAMLYLANLIFVGPKGSGKTSLIRRLQGDQFRLTEPSTHLYTLPDDFCELIINKPWIPNGNALNYENELTRCIIEHLLKHIKTQLPQQEETAFLLPISRDRSATFTYGPPLPPRPNHHLSMLIEDSHFTPTISFSGSQPEGLNRTPPTSPVTKQRSIRKRFSFSNIFSTRKSSNDNSSKKPKQFHNVQEPHSSPRHIQVVSSPTHRITSDTPPDTPDSFVSAIPESIEERLKEKLKDCVGGVLPPEIYGRLVDWPGNMLPVFPRSCLLNKSSIIIAVINTSSNDDAQIHQLVAEVNAVFQQSSSSSSSSSPSIVLIGTHTDKTLGTNAKQYLDRTRKALQESRCGQYLAKGHFLFSNSSVLDQSIMDGIKTSIIDIVKTKCSYNIPLKWMRCVRRVQSISKSGRHMLSLEEMKGIVKDVCEEGEEELVIKFLHDCHVILYFSHVTSFENIVITDPKWFIEKFCALFSLGHPSTTVPTHLSHDHHLLLSQGSLTQNLLDHVWGKLPKSTHQELILLMHQLELIGLRGTGSRPISPWESEQSLSPHNSPPPSTITSIIIPDVVQECLPNDIAEPPVSLEPLYFRYSTGYVPCGIISRLVIRCIQSYPECTMLYSNGSCYTIDSTTVLLIQTLSDGTKITLQPSHHSTSQPSPSSSSSSYSLLPTSDVAMSTFMFLQAALTDIINTWLSHSVTFNVSIRCTCDSSKPHYMVLHNTDSILHEKFIECESGTRVAVPELAKPWFGQDITLHDDSVDDEFVSINDLKILSENIQDKDSENMMDWANERTASFLDLISCLENIGRNDVADTLIDARMKTSSIAL